MSVSEGGERGETTILGVESAFVFAIAFLLLKGGDGREVSAWFMEDDAPGN